MFRCISFRRVSSLLAACALALDLGGCAVEAGEDAAANEAQIDHVSSALPLEAVSVDGANFGALQLGAGVGAGTLGTTASLGSGAVTDTGTVGTTISSGSSLGPIGFSSSSSSSSGSGPIGFSSSSSTGPIGFSSSSSSGTGPIGFSSSFDTGPVVFSSGGGTSIQSASGGPAVIQSCLGPECL